MKNKLSIINSDLQKYRKLINLENKTKPTISNWSLYKQIEHTLITTNNVAQMILDKSKWTKEAGGKTFIGFAVLAGGFIPRGKGKAPEVVNPQGIDKDALIKLFEETEITINKLEKFTSGDINQKTKISKHPYFGVLSIKEWIRMIEVHQKHHLKIIKDIINA